MGDSCVDRRAMAKGNTSRQRYRNIMATTGEHTDRMTAFLTPSTTRKIVVYRSPPRLLNAWHCWRATRRQRWQPPDCRPGRRLSAFQHLTGARRPTALYTALSRMLLCWRSCCKLTKSSINSNSKQHSSLVTDRRGTVFASNQAPRRGILA